MGQVYTLPHVGVGTLKVYEAGLPISTSSGRNAEGLHITTRGGSNTDCTGKDYKYFIIS